MKKNLEMTKAILTAVLLCVGGVALLLSISACSSLVDPDGHAAPASTGKRITFVAPTPAPIEIFWIDSAGNIGLRGADAIVPGVPPPASDPKSPKYSEACRKSAEANGDGTLTVCMNPVVGRELAEKLGIGWTSGTSGKP